MKQRLDNSKLTKKLKLSTLKMSLQQQMSVSVTRICSYSSSLLYSVNDEREGDISHDGTSKTDGHQTED